MRNYISYYCFLLCKALNVFSGSVLGVLRCWWWAIPTAAPVKAFGTFRVEKHPGATIRIGRRCCLRSSRCSNVSGINRPVTLAARFEGELIIGDDCGISSSVLVADRSIRLGNRVMIGVNCNIYDTDFHPLEAVSRIQGKCGKAAPVVIEDDVWLCMNVTVLKGVTIGRGSVVASNSVVVSDIPPGVLAGGIPARVIRPLEVQ